MSRTGIPTTVRALSFPARRWLGAAFIAAFLVLDGLAVQAILFHSTGDPNYNTEAPTGLLADSGWQWQGRWGRFLGTPIHPKYFVTAAHVGGRIGEALVLDGQSYLTTFSTNVPGSDLRLWRICGQFPDFAPVHTNHHAVGRSLVWFGRGTQRGSEVILTNGAMTELRGWEWGQVDGELRWGTNRVEEVVDGEPGIGPLLRAAFDKDGGEDECHLSTGDSGGAAFVREGNRWELAGIHYAVDGPYRRTTGGTEFKAALFDHRGLLMFDGTNWVEVADDDGLPAGSLYATDVSAHAGWISEFISQEVPADSTPVLQSAEGVDGIFTDVAEALVDPEAQTIRLSAPVQLSFFRLRSCSSSLITDVSASAGILVFRYE
jgi:hypothetical protein